MRPIDLIAFVVLILAGCGQSEPTPSERAALAHRRESAKLRSLEASYAEHRAAVESMLPSRDRNDASADLAREIGWAALQHDEYTNRMESQKQRVSSAQQSLQRLDSR